MKCIFEWTASLKLGFLWQLILISKAKVVNVQVIAGNDGTTFTVCLDQDEKKFIQGVTR